jgi:hypothetical protein
MRYGEYLPLGVGFVFEQKVAKDAKRIGKEDLTPSRKAAKRSTARIAIGDPATGEET